VGSLKLRRKVKVVFIILLFLFLLIFSIFLLVFNNKQKSEINEKYESELVINKDDLVEDDKEIIKDDKLSKEIKKSALNSNLFSTTAKKIMIVAHPDDESIFGGNALFYDKYLVVCITCGVNAKRVEEFKMVMSKYGDDFIMLSYPDLVNNKKSNWDKEYTSIDADLKMLLSLKKWDLVITHNPDGEYGHIHHKMTNKIVTSHSDKSKLYYFGKFYWGNIPNKEKLYKLTEEEYKYKKEVIFPIYKTQKGAIDNLRNMHPYESWVSYDEWYGE